ncbi:hypothetical protein SADUNF_Sadunf04G0015300 [Salix dunnii]|uniref:Uncharacterized protein n=1 Tax=Salix dunnii TaxID=1413687 RepID=A0A835K6D6_9ROSI|nr:hypothetical protein SADUNF_Sadunf04G0015300 [Salix dunnii]
MVSVDRQIWRRRNSSNEMRNLLLLLMLTRAAKTAASVLAGATVNDNYFSPSLKRKPFRSSQKCLKFLTSKEDEKETEQGNRVASAAKCNSNVSENRKRVAVDTLYACQNYMCPLSEGGSDSFDRNSTADHELNCAPRTEGSDNSQENIDGDSDSFAHIRSSSWRGGSGSKLEDYSSCWDTGIDGLPLGVAFDAGKRKREPGRASTIVTVTSFTEQAALLDIAGRFCQSWSDAGGFLVNPIFTSANKFGQHDFEQSLKEPVLNPKKSTKPKMLGTGPDFSFKFKLNANLQYGYTSPSKSIPVTGPPPWNLTLVQEQLWRPIRIEPKRPTACTRIIRRFPGCQKPVQTSLAHGMRRIIEALPYHDPSAIKQNELPSFVIERVPEESLRGLSLFATHTTFLSEILLYQIPRTEESKREGLPTGNYNITIFNRLVHTNSIQGSTKLDK